MGLTVVIIIAEALWNDYHGSDIVSQYYTYKLI